MSAFENWLRQPSTVNGIASMLTAAVGLVASVLTGDMTTSVALGGMVYAATNIAVKDKVAAEEVRALYLRASTDPRWRNPQASTLNGMGAAAGTVLGVAAQVVTGDIGSAAAVALMAHGLTNTLFHDNTSDVSNSDAGATPKAMALGLLLLVGLGACTNDPARDAVEARCLFNAAGKMVAVVDPATSDGWELALLLGGVLVDNAECRAAH